MANPILTIVSRIGRLFGARVHDALDQIEGESAGTIARDAVRGLSEDIARAEAALIHVVGDQKSIEHSRDVATREIAEWTELATLAVKAGNDKLATAALGRVTESEAAQLQLTHSLDLLKPQVLRLRERIEGFRASRRSLSSEATLLDARATAAAATNRAARASGGVGSVTVSFESLRERVAMNEARAEAAQEIVSERDGGDLKVQFAALSNRPVSDRLSALKVEVQNAARAEGENHV